MSVLAKADPEALDDLVSGLPDVPGYEFLRRPEPGSVMVRGRTGGTGSPFNLGEMTVTRCAVRLANGVVGHAYVQGRNVRHAESAAVMDALLQDPERSETLGAEVIEPLAAAFESTRVLRARKAAATRVDFFTLVRGENS